MAGSKDESQLYTMELEDQLKAARSKAMRLGMEMEDLRDSAEKQSQQMAAFRRRITDLEGVIARNAASEATIRAELEREAGEAQAAFRRRIVEVEDALADTSVFDTKHRRQRSELSARVAELEKELAMSRATNRPSANHSGEACLFTFDGREDAPTTSCCCGNVVIHWSYHQCAHRMKCFCNDCQQKLRWAEHKGGRHYAGGAVDVTYMWNDIDILRIKSSQGGIGCGLMSRQSMVLLPTSWWRSAVAVSCWVSTHCSRIRSCGRPQTSPISLGPR